MATNSTLQLPNPHMPLAYLPPELASAYQGVTYLFVGTLSVSSNYFSKNLAEICHHCGKAFIWDWLMSIPEEIAICRQRKFGPAIVAYFLSRSVTILPFFLLQHFDGTLESGRLGTAQWQRCSNVGSLYYAKYIIY
jgi:hypothetical protein